MFLASARFCEVKIGGSWRRMAAEQAHTLYLGAFKRCPACHGAVMTMSPFSSAETYSLQHSGYHRGCQLAAQGFSGKASRHPDALD